MPRPQAQWMYYRNLNATNENEHFSEKYRNNVVDHCYGYLLEDVTVSQPCENAVWQCRYGGKKGEGCRQVCLWLKTPNRAKQLSKSEASLIIHNLDGRLQCDPKKVDYCSDQDGNRLDAMRMALLLPTGSYYSR